MKPTFIMFHVPRNRALLAAFGELALRHEHMNYGLRMMIKTVAEITVEEAIAATKYEGSRKLRDRIRKIARKRLGEGQPLLKLQAILANCERLSDLRNELVHGLWAKELDGKAHVRDEFGGTRPLPKTKQLRELAQQTANLTNQMNEERLNGFLAEALKKPKTN